MTPLHWLFGLWGLALDALGAVVSVAIHHLPCLAFGLGCFFFGILACNGFNPEK